MHVPWEDVQLFLAVAEGGSVTAAAKRLQVTQPTASRRLAEFERRLGEPLFVRSVEGVRLTPFGERLLEPARRMAEWAGEVDRAAEHAETAPSGVVRVTAPPGVAFEVLAPFAARLRAELPQVSLEVIAQIGYLDLARREADLALRMDPGPRELVRIATIEHGVAAFGSPAYAKTLPKRATVADVAWIGWAPPLDHLSPNPELAAAIPGFRPAFASDDFLVQLRAAYAGVGAIFLGRTRRRDPLESPLVELEVALPAVTRKLHLVAAKSALAIPRVRAVADLLADELRFVGGRRPKR